MKIYAQNVYIKLSSHVCIVYIQHLRWRQRWVDNRQNQRIRLSMLLQGKLKLQVPLCSTSRGNSFFKRLREFFHGVMTWILFLLLLSSGSTSHNFWRSWNSSRATSHGRMSCGVSISNLHLFVISHDGFQNAAFPSSNSQPLSKDFTTRYFLYAGLIFL